MARTKITVDALAHNGAIDYPDGTEIDSGLVTAGAYVDLEEVQASQLLLIVANADEAATLDVTVKAGDKPPAMLAGHGDIVAEITAESTVILGPFDGQRVTQQGSADEDDHTLHIDFEVGLTGSIIALEVPRHA